MASGGFLNVPRVNYSKNTQDLLKVMMKESKLTNFQQRQIDKTLKEGNSLPPTVHPTSSAKKRSPQTRMLKSNSKIVDIRTYVSQTRTKEQIEASGAYETESYHPAPLTKFGGHYEKDKARLCNMMTYGEETAPPVPQNKRPPAELTDEIDIDRFDELQLEIEDRQRFLEEMEKIGQGGRYRTIIATEISQKIREMELIDKKRSQELQKMVNAYEKERAAIK